MDIISYKLSICRKVIRDSGLVNNNVSQIINMKSNIINMLLYVFPIIGGKNRTKQNDFKLIEPDVVYGSAFYLKNNVFITAGHVLKGISNNNQIMGIGYCVDEIYSFYEINEFEIIEDYDLGIFKVESPIDKYIKWYNEELYMLDDIFCHGYPYALDLEKSLLHIRSFKGYIVSRQTSNHLKVNSRIYELSFDAPRGLSGAPLFFVYQNKLRIAGIIQGNKSTDMLVFTDKEIISSNKETIIERYETLNLGIAIQTCSIFDIQSSILECSLYEYLKKNKLL